MQKKLMNLKPGEVFEYAGREFVTLEACVIIINKQDSARYYRTDDPAEIKRQYRQNDRQAKSLSSHNKNTYAGGLKP
jgi:hypothetical protein